MCCVVNWIQRRRLSSKRRCPGVAVERSPTGVSALRNVVTLVKGGTTVGKRIVTLLAAASLWAAASVDAKLVTWTLHDVTFDDGGTASGFFTFDPTTPSENSQQTQYLTDFLIKTTGGRTMAPFDFSPANTDASVPWFVNFFSAPESPTPRHGLPQRVLHLFIDGAFPIEGGKVAILSEDSTDALFLENGRIFRTLTGGFLVGAVVPEPTDLAFLGAGLLVLLKRRARSLHGFLRRS
jgi:hypothetical protein